VPRIEALDDASIQVEACRLPLTTNVFLASLRLPSKLHHPVDNTRPMRAAFLLLESAASFDCLIDIRRCCASLHTLLASISSQANSNLPQQWVAPNNHSCTMRLNTIPNSILNRSLKPACGLLPYLNRSKRGHC
jgi:hypothetical protein